METTPSSSSPTGPRQEEGEMKESAASEGHNFPFRLRWEEEEGEDELGGGHRRRRVGRRGSLRGRGQSEGRLNET